MVNRRVAAEETYQVEDEKEGLWSKVKGWFGPDELDGEPEPQEPEVSLHNRRHHNSPGFFQLSGSRQFRVSVRLNATTMEHAQDAVDSLKDRNQVILNLERAEDGMDRRILDFVSGACYALDGFYQRVGTKVFLFAPSNIYIEVEDESLSTSPGSASNGSVRTPSFLQQE